MTTFIILFDIRRCFYVKFDRYVNNLRSIRKLIDLGKIRRNNFKTIVTNNSTSNSEKMVGKVRLRRTVVLVNHNKSKIDFPREIVGY